MVECNLAKVDVASSNLVSRSKRRFNRRFLFFVIRAIFSTKKAAPESGLSSRSLSLLLLNPNFGFKRKITADGSTSIAHAKVAQRKRRFQVN